MQTRHATKMGLGVLIMTCAFLAATPAQAALTLRCNWGIGGAGNFAPTIWIHSTQVMMMPTVMDFGGPPFGRSKIAFISFETASQINRDGGGVLRIIDDKCNEIARYPDPNFPVFIPALIAAGCPANLSTIPRLAPASGLAVGNVDTNPDVEIIAVIDEPNTSNHKQLVAFNLIGGALNPKWCSSPLPAGDFITGPSAPAIALVDRPTPVPMQRQIIIDNKVFDGNGVLRYTGGNGPRSRTAVVANLIGGTALPQVITGRASYQSLPLAGPAWTGTLGWQNLNVGSTPLVYPAIADLDPSSGPEIVVTDTMANTLRVLRPSGAQLASILLPFVAGCPGTNCPCPGSQCPKCGGPPMIGDADGIPGPEIGVASCNRYTLYKYSVVGGVGTLTQVWSTATSDPGGQTTSTLYNTPTGARIYYADAHNLLVFNGANGNVIQSVSNSSGTSIEGPVIAAFDTGPALATVIVAANNYWFGGQKGVRIFDDPTIGPARSFWNQHTYHATNVTNSFGAIPTVEPRSWLSPARNTYRVQQP